MQFLQEHDHKVLAYVEAVQRQGYTLNWTEFEAFASRPNRRPGRTQLRATRKLTAGFAKALQNMPIDVIEAPERTIDYFLRMGWIDTEPLEERSPDGWVAITDLGSALLRHTEAEDLPGESDLTIVLDPQDPFSYARVIGRIADLGDSLLIDPYFGLDQLSHIAFRTSVTRVLTSYAKESDLVALGTALEAMNVERPFSIRVAERGAIHDRYVISEGGRVHFIGTSLSGVGKKPSAMGEIHGPAAQAVTRIHEDIWSAADEIDFGEADTDGRSFAAPGVRTDP